MYRGQRRGAGRHAVIARAVATAALLALWSVSQATAVRADGAWSQPFELGNDEFGWFPDVAADPQGAIHVIWGSGSRNPDAAPDSPESSRDLLRYRALRDGQWSPMSDVAFTCVGGYTVRNSIAAGPGGQLNALVRSCFDVTAVRAFAPDAASARAWSEPQRLGSSYYNALAVDSAGTLHALYNEGVFGAPDDAGLLSEIFYRRSTDGGQTWSVRTNLATMPGGDERMQVAVDARDRVHVVWDHGSDWYLGLDAPGHGVYRRSDDGGLTWKEPLLLGVDAGPTVQTTLAVTPEGNPLVVYRSAESSELYYQQSRDGGDTWTAGEQIPGVLARGPNERGLDRYSMATDSAGRVHLLMAGLPAGSAAAIPMLLHLTWDGQQWSAPEVISATLNRPMWPRTVVSGGNTLHAVWFSYTDESGWGERRVWHSSRALEAPSIPPAPLAAPAAQAPATGAPEGTAIPEATAAGAAQAPAAGAPEAGSASAASEPPAAQPAPPAPHTFSDAPPPSGLTSAPFYLAPLLSLLPVLGLILAVVVLARWWHTRGS